MTKRRRAANPMFQRPLTAQEATGIVREPKRPFRQITCINCGGRGLAGLHKKTDDVYACNDVVLCAMQKERNDRDECSG